MGEAEDDVTLLRGDVLACGAVVPVVDVGPSHNDRRSIALVGGDLKPSIVGGIDAFLGITLIGLSKLMKMA